MKLAYNMYMPGEVVPEGLAPIILLHSITETKDSWRTVAPLLANKTLRRVYAPDFRNHGKSPWSDDYNVDLLVSDLREFLHDRRVDRIVLVGHSFGGTVAIAFTLQEPQRVERLVVEEARVRRVRNGDHTFVSQVFSFYTRNALEDFLSANTEEAAKEIFSGVLRTVCPLFSITEDVINTYPFENYPVKWDGKTLKLELNLDVILDTVQNKSLQPSELQGKYEGETLFIIGKKSQFNVLKDKSVGEHFSRTSRVVFEKAGHFVHFCFPQEFTRIVGEFINRGVEQQSKY